MSFTIKGTIHTVFEAKQINDKMTKREFVVETADNPKYPQKVMFEIIGDKCSQLDGLQSGDGVSVEFDVRGREWRSPQGPIKYFNSLSAWKVEKTTSAQPATGSAQSRQATTSYGGNAPGGVDDIPFASCDINAEPSAIARVLR